MANKIDGYGQPQVPVAKSNRGTAADNVARPEGARTDGKPVEPVAAARDAVSLTDSARLMKRLEDVVRSAPATDAGKVERIRQALARHEYTIDPERIATKLLEFERELGRR